MSTTFIRTPFAKNIVGKSVPAGIFGGNSIDPPFQSPAFLDNSVVSGSNPRGGFSDPGFNALQYVMGKSVNKGINTEYGKKSNHRINWTRVLRPWDDDMNVLRAPTHGHIVFSFRNRNIAASNKKALALSDKAAAHNAAWFNSQQTLTGTLPVINFLLAQNDDRTPDIEANDVWEHGIGNLPSGITIDGVTVFEDGDLTEPSLSTNYKDMSFTDRLITVTLEGGASTFSMFGRDKDHFVADRLLFILKRVEICSPKRYNLDAVNGNSMTVAPPKGDDGKPLPFRPFQLVPYCSHRFPFPSDDLLKFYDYSSEDSMDVDDSVMHGKVIQFGRLRALQEADYYLPITNPTRGDNMLQSDVMHNSSYITQLPKIEVDIDVREF